MAADVVKLKEAKAAGGATAKISTEGGVRVGTANVTKTTSRPATVSSE
ncbi:MAG: hypothetical protein ACKOWG_07370 [Planctomycetia bacterium]